MSRLHRHPPDACDTDRAHSLDSRQRKKQHTERLEDEKKQYTTVINDLEEDLAEARLALEDYARKESRYEQYIANLNMEKDELIGAHTLETGDLRKKVGVLTDHIQKMESTTMSTVPSSTGYPTDFSDVGDHLGIMDNGAWEDGFSFMHDFPATTEIKQETALLPLRKPEAEQEKPAAQGLLLMLLLFGAFVASKGSVPSIPRMSDDVRAASATLLEDIFADAGVSHTADPSTVLSQVPGTSVPASANSWSANPVIRSGPFPSQPASRLGDLTDQLSQPTEQQSYEQLFSLSAAQYEGVTSHDFLNSAPTQSTSQGRRNLGETLATMRQNSKQSAAEVYTRSLLWDKVPSEVVRDFARMVSDCDSQNRQEGTG